MGSGGSSAARSLSIAVVLVALALAPCAGGCRAAPIDPAFASPKATVTTLLRAHQLDRLPTEEIQRRMARTDSGRFGAVDEVLVARCFDDFDPHDPVDHGLVGFLVGVLAARRDELTPHTQGDRSAVAAGPAATIVLHRGDEGWKISLEESIPRAYRERMESLYERARTRTGSGDTFLPPK